MAHASFLPIRVFYGLGSAFGRCRGHIFYKSIGDHGFFVIFLHETVGPRRWSATFIGLAGVLIIVRPGTSAFQFVSLLPIMAAVGYALLHILTRRIGGTESAATMTFYIQLTFIFVSLVLV